MNRSLLDPIFDPLWQDKINREIERQQRRHFELNKILWLEEQRRIADSASQAPIEGGVLVADEDQPIEEQKLLPKPD